MSESKKQKPANDQTATEATSKTTDDKVTSKTSTKPAETKPAAAQTKPAPSKSNKRSSIIAWVLVALLAALMIAAAWFGYRHVWPMHQQQITQMAAQQDTAQTTIKELQGRLNELEQAVNARVRSSVENLEQRVDAQLGRQQQTIDDYQLAVQSVQAELANLDISQESNWRIFEARNLAKRAATKLWIEHNPNAALAFLQLAESHIVALDNPAHRMARQALANDIAVLEQLPPSQIGAISLKLGTLRDQVARSEWYQQFAMSSPENNDTTDGTWLTNLQRSFNTLLQQFIHVQRRDTPVEPMIADAYFDVLQQRLLLQLQLAQQAAMTDSQAMFTATIEEAVALINTLQGQVSDANFELLLNELQALKTTQLRPEYPTELSATQQLERLANQVNQGG